MTSFSNDARQDARPAGSLSKAQESTPLVAAVSRFFEDPGATFTTPGHKRAPWLADPLLSLDLPLAAGADDNQLSGGYLRQAEALAAELWSAEYGRFSVNGSTLGNQALALAVAADGARVAVSRNLHKSMFAGLVLAGLEPFWMYPEIDPTTGLSAGLPTTEVERALDCGISAVMLVEPSYTGAISDLSAIVARAHERGVPVLVDQAWGAHLGLHPAFPGSALRDGADAIVISAHKTLAAFTQSALLLARGDLLDFDRLDAAFELLNTTSPSAAMLASIDRTRHTMATRGAELLSRTLVLARRIRRELSEVEGLKLLDESSVQSCPAMKSFDPLKIVILLAGTGANGVAVEADLIQAGVRVEMADRDVIIPLLTIGDDDRTVDKLVGALRTAVERRRGEPRSPARSIAWSVRATAAITPREAFQAPRERVDARSAVGRISAETAALYPPGIPVLAPGEVVSKEMLEGLRAEAAAGRRVAYCSDPTLSTLLVVSRK
jgi:arginine decarboxylase